MPTPNLLVRLKLRDKFLLLLLIPTAALAVFAGAQIRDRYHTVQRMERVQQLAELNTQISLLVHEAQKERGRSSLYLGSKAERPQPELVAQRQATDTEVAALQAALADFDDTRSGSAFKEKLDHARKQLAEFTSLRGRIDSRSVPAKEAIAFYTGTVSALLEVSTQIGYVAGDPEVARLVGAEVALAQVKERAGLERATLSNGFARGKFDPGLFEQAVSLDGQRAAFLATFRSAASPEQYALHEQTIQGPAVETTAEMRRRALDRANADRLEGVDPTVWFDQSTVVIELQKKVEDSLSADVMAAAARLGQAAQRALVVWSGIALVVTALTFGLAAAVIRSITRPIGVLRQSLQQIARQDLPSLAVASRALAVGDLTHDVTVGARPVDIASRDEVGQMAGDLNHMIAGLSEAGGSFAEMTANLRELLAQVQASADAVAGTSEELGSAADQAGIVVQQVAHAVQSVAEGAQETNSTAQQTSHAVWRLVEAIDGIARGAEDQAREVQQASATAVEMAAAVDEMARNAGSVATASQQTRASAEHGKQAVDEAVRGMGEIRAVVSAAASSIQELGKLGEKIGAVVETIGDIAEQTNLLALNAAIEAARAGEHGQGFAVVADEVRKLAERSGRETKQIVELIQQVQTGTREAVRAMELGAAKVEEGSTKADQAGHALGEILEAVEATVGQVTEIAAAAQQMAAGARSVTEAMRSISAVVQQSTVATEEMAARSKQMSSANQSIAAMAEEQSASTEEVSASAEEMSAQVEEMGAQALELAGTAEQLRALVARFKVEAGQAAAEGAFGTRPHGRQDAFDDEAEHASRAAA